MRSHCHATGRMSHSFDKTTHQCKCGRWERGYAPKKECQCCEGRFATRHNQLGHHGYKRPGIGYILGDCMGVGYAPYPAYDALEKLLGIISDNIARLATEVNGLVTTPSLSYVCSMGYNKTDTKTFEVKRDDKELGGFNGNYHYSVPSWKTLLSIVTHRLNSELSWFQTEEMRVRNRINNAKELTK